MDEVEKNVGFKEFWLEFRRHFWTWLENFHSRKLCHNILWISCRSFGELGSGEIIWHIILPVNLKKNIFFCFFLYIYDGFWVCRYFWISMKFLEELYKYSKFVTALAIHSLNRIFTYCYSWHVVLTGTKPVSQVSVRWL